MNLLLMNWVDDTGNKVHEDFKLYRILMYVQEDKKPWTFCNCMYPGMLSQGTVVQTKESMFSGLL